MTNQCPTCNQPMPGQRQQQPPQEGGRATIKIGSLPAFRELCTTLLSSPNCKNPDFVKALKEFPGIAEEYKGNIFEGRAKFFGVIHREVFGRYYNPHELTKLTDPMPAQFSPEGEMEDVPF